MPRNITSFSPLLNCLTFFEVCLCRPLSKAVAEISRICFQLTWSLTCALSDSLLSALLVPSENGNTPARENYQSSWLLSSIWPCKATKPLDNFELKLIMLPEQDNATSCEELLARGLLMRSPLLPPTYKDVTGHAVQRAACKWCELFSPCLPHMLEWSWPFLALPRNAFVFGYLLRQLCFKIVKDFSARALFPQYF